MGGNQQGPDIMCEVFILAPTDLVDDHEISDTRRSLNGSAGEMREGSVDLPALLEDEHPASLPRPSVTPARTAARSTASSTSGRSET